MQQATEDKINMLIMEHSDLTVKIHFRNNYVKFKKYYFITFQQIIDSLRSNNYSIKYK